MHISSCHILFFSLLQAKKEYIVEDLLKSIVVASANDASVAISEYLFGSEENAVVAMEKAAKNNNLTSLLDAQLKAVEASEAL